jgi:hypothetical protein
VKSDSKNSALIANKQTPEKLNSNPEKGILEKTFPFINAS